MIIVLLIGLGLILGSFVNASVWRLHEQEELKAKKQSKASKAYSKAISISKGRSMCPHCKHELAAKDLVPLFSWLWLRGKCRYCKQKIDDNPLFVFSYIFWPVTLNGQGLFDFIVWLIFLTAFIALAVYDLRWYILPNKIVYPLIILAVIQVLVDVAVFGAPLTVLLQAGMGALCIAGLFYLLFVLSDGNWIGGGDVKLGAVIGILAGSALNALFLIFVSSLLGLVAAIPMMMRGQATRKSQLPFGPFLLAATFITVLFGSRVVDAYISLFRI
jgi:leader peptidase (prepilin peptidase)/N-methyltransferase